MTVEFALAYAPRRMDELGYGDRYYLKWRHLLIKPYQQMIIPAYSQHYLLVDEPQEVRIESEFGCYDLLETTINEMLYEHQGLITIKNNSSETARIRFIQIIPQHRKKWHATR